MSNRIVLTGPSGAGKSSVCDKLSKLGYNVVEEPARELITYFSEHRPSYLPWNNRDKFQKSVEEKNMSNWSENEESFFDRSLVDEIGFRTFYKMDVPQYLINDCKSIRYDKVFMFPPWREIYINDSVRRESFESSSGVYQPLIKGYEDVGYEIIYMPKASILDRVNFIVERSF